MRIKLLFALLLALVCSFMLFAGFARATDTPNPHGSIQAPPEMRLYYKEDAVRAANPYWDKMSIQSAIEVQKDGQPFFSVISTMPENDTSGVIAATSVFCYSIDRSAGAIDVYLENVVGVYLFKVNPQDKSKPKVDRIYYDDSVPCMAKFRQKQDKK